MNSQCSVGLLESALAGNLPADDEAALHRHLEECEQCGAVLERMAGGPAWCQEVASMLPEDELDEAVPVRNDWSEVDFTVEHLEPSDEPNVLGRLGGYDVLEIIGHGGMGVVLKGFDRELKRCVAIKVLAPHLARSSLAKKRFAREAQAAAAVVHPNVLAIHQVQPNGRLPFLVMPLVAGESLAERLTARGTLELKETLRIGMQAAAGLAAAHEQGLVHRDVKPANILLEKGVERAVLTDFGLARAADDVVLTRWGIIAGTPQYMSPEQARGEPLDSRSDLFSLGCVLYEMATGVSPFRTDSMLATLRRLVDDAPQAMGSLNPELPRWFIAIVDRLLEKDPSRRFGSAREVSELLEGCLAHVQQPANVPLPAALPKPVPQPVSGRRKKLVKGVIALFAVLGIGWLGKFIFLLPEPPDGAGAAVGIETSAVEAGRVLVTGKIDRSHDLVVRIDRDERPMEWRTRGAGGVFEVVVEASDEVPLDGGKTGHGFVVTTTQGTSKNVSNIDLTEENGTFAIRREADFVTRDGILTLADVTLKDGKKLPVSLRLADLPRTRSSDNSNEPPTTTNPVAPKAQPEQPETTNDIPKRVRHFPTGASVKTIAHSADGKRIAIANGNPTFPLKDHWKRSVKILDAETGTTVVSLKLTTDEEDAVLTATQAQFTVGPLEFSPDGNVVAVGNSIGQVKLFDARTGELVRLLDDEKAKLAEKTASEKFNTLKRAMGKVASLAFSPDGSLLVTCGSSFEDAERSWGGVQRLGELATGPGRLKVWEVNTGTLKHDLVGHSHANAVSFSPDGNLLASAGNWLTDSENGTGVIIWNPQTGTKISTIPNNDNGGTHAVAFSPNSKLVVSGSRIFDKDNDSSTTNVSLAHVGTGIMEWRQTVSGWANPKAFSPDGKCVIVLCSGQSIRFFETETGTVKHEIRSTDSPQAARWNDFSLPPQGHMLAIGGTNLEGRGFVAVWNLDGVPPDKEQSKTGGTDARKNVGPRHVRQFPTGAKVETIACSSDGKLITIANGNATFPSSDDGRRTAKILDAETGKTVVSLQLATDEEEAVLAATEGLPDFEVGPLAFSPDGSVVAVGTGIGQVKLFNTQTGELVQSLDDEPAKLAEIKTPKVLKSLKRAMGSARSLAFSPDGSLLATCGESFEDVARDWGGILREGFTVTGPGRLKVWEVKTGMLKHDLVGHDRHANAVAFSPDGSLLASAGSGLSRGGNKHGTGVILWNPQTGAKIRTFSTEANGGTWSVAFSPNSKLVAIRSQYFDKDNEGSTSEVRLTHAASGLVQWRKKVSGWGQPVAFSPDGKSVAVLCGGQSIRFIDTESGKVTHEIRSIDFLPATPRQGSQWNAFAITPHGHRLAICGVDNERKGTVEVWDFDGPGAAVNSAPVKDGENQEGQQGTTKSSGAKGQNDAVPERFKTSILNDDVRWDARGLNGPFDILSATFDPSLQQITWTLRATPRHGPAFNFHAVLYDKHGQVVIEDAPLSWAPGRRVDGTVHLVSLDVRWLARRVADSAPQVAAAVIERHPGGALGRTRQINQEEVRKRTPEKLATGILPDDAIWRHEGFRSNSEVLEVTFDPAAGKVTWVLEALPRTYQGRSFRVSFYDRAGNLIGPHAPLICSSGKRDNHPVELAVLDLAYFVELLGNRTRDVATVAVERIGEP